jgi:hypothetical protein
MVVVLSPAIARAASWESATTTVVHAGVSGHSTFVIAAYVSLPAQCYVARIRTSYSVIRRQFVVEQMPGSPSCTAKTVYHCTVMSPEFSLPISNPFNVHSAGKWWEVPLAAKTPEPLPPMCAKP